MSSQIHYYWFVLPLVFAISLVYSASRHEDWARIWKHTGRLTATLMGVLIAVMVGLLLINTQV